MVEIEGVDDHKYHYIVRNDDINDAADIIIRIIEGHGDSDYFGVAEFKYDLTALIEGL